MYKPSDKMLLALEELKHLNPEYYLQVGRYLDIKDRYNIWRVSKIISKSKNELDIIVHFDGWLKKWDEVN